MDQAPRLADFLTLADGHLRAAAFRPQVSSGPYTVAAEIGCAADVAHVLVKYLDDVLADNLLEVIIRRRPGSRAHSAAEARYALTMAQASLRAAAGAAHPLAPGEQGDQERGSGLAATASCLAVGRDLLATHFTTDAAGIRTSASRWTQVIASAAFTGALLDYIGRQAGQLAAWVARTSYVTADESALGDTARDELGSAQQWLAFASSASQASRRRQPVTAAENALLNAVPVNAVPEPRPVTGPEPVPVLCEEILASAERLRMIVRWRPAHAASSPLLTAPSWRWTATATAVASDLSELLLSALADRVDTAGRWSEVAQRSVAEAARAAAAACTSWQHTAAAWKYMVTETKGMTAPGLADTGDLVLRLGRLAFDDPLWTPARSRQAPVRAPADIAPGPEQAALVLTAVHHAADALTLTSVADQHAVRHLVAAQRLYVPARTRAESRYAIRGTDVPRPFVPALGVDTFALSDAYAASATASAELTAALDVAAVMTGAPSQTLAFVRAASRTPLGAEDMATTATAEELADRQVSRYLVESAVRRTGVTEPIMLFRAKMIDQAGRQLIAEAAGTLPTSTPGEGAPAGAAKANAAVTAAQSFPPPAQRSGKRNPTSRPSAERTPVIDQARLRRSS